MSLEKRSLVVAGHRTSLALEPAFWEALAEMAAEAGLSLPVMIARIDAARQDAGLASAVRVAVLGHLRAVRPGTGKAGA